MGVTVALLDNVESWIPRIQQHLHPGEELLTAAQVSTAGRANEVDAALTEGTASGLAAYPNLRFAQSIWAGVNGLLADLELAPKVIVARMVADSLTVSMAEFVTASVLFLHRRFPVYASQQRSATWIEHKHLAAAEYPVAILGAGVLSQASGEMLRAVGFPVAMWARTPRPNDPLVRHGEAGLHELLAESAAVVCLLPLTNETNGIINAALLARCRPGVALVNPGRGRHVVDADLFEALDSGHVDHAILDVFTTEPLPAAHRYWSHPRVTIMPHIAASSTADSVARAAAAGLLAFRTGQPVPNLVNRTLGY